jgi:uncharacterized membrane protein YphA (DoxX/SURF4 family)
MKKYISLIAVAFLSLVMISSGFNKIIKYKELPSPNYLIEKYSDNTMESNFSQEGSEIRYNNYKFGLKQSGFFWQFLGLCEFILGLLLIFIRIRFFALLMLLSITANIFLMHFFLEPHELGELVYTGLLFAINIYLIINCKDKLVNMFSLSS